MISANQYYKNSNTELPFKQWLKVEQMKGKLAVHDSGYLNADGDDYNYADGDDGSTENAPAPKRFEERFIRRRSFIFGAVLGYAICVLDNKK